MSHLVTVKTSMTDTKIIKSACERLGLQYTLNSSARLYDASESHGTVVQLTDWEYPLVITADGELCYDNYGGSWGDIQELDKLRQTYARLALEETLMLSGMAITGEEVSESGELVLHVEQI